MKAEVELFKAVSDETRIRILKLLAGCEKPICVCEIVDSLQLPQYLVSRHLNILRRAGLADDSRDGIWVSYSIPDRLSPLVHRVLEAINHHLNGSLFDEDRQRLTLRFRLRQGGRCVVGYDNNEFSKLGGKLEKTKNKMARGRFSSKCQEVGIRKCLKLETSGREEVIKDGKR